MSERNDLTAYVRVAGTIRDGIDIRAHFWIPSETAVKRQRESGVPFLEYASRGWVTIVPGPIIDPHVVRDYILDDAAKLEGRLKRIHGDFYRTYDVGESLISEGVEFVWFKQNPLSMHPPIETTEGLIARRLCRHSSLNPLLDYCMSNAVRRQTRLQNKYLDKPTANDKVDGAVALVEAVAALADLTGWDGTGGEEAKAVKYDENPQIVWFNPRRG
jgi:phage terminase large subunit-like protein